MSEWNGDPLHERDLPNAELMLARILRDAEHDHVVVEELDDLDAEPRGRRWLYAVAAAVMVIALASIGWMVSRPDSRSTQPAQQPTVVASSTPAPSPSIEATPTPATLPEPVETTTEPEPEPTPTRRTPTPSPTASALPSDDETASAEATPTLTGDRVEILSATRRGPTESGEGDYVDIEFTVCPGSRGATFFSPVVGNALYSSVTADEPWGRGRILLNANTCTTTTIWVVVPSEPTRISLTFDVVYPEDHSMYDGQRTDSVLVN